MKFLKLREKELEILRILSEGIFLDAFFNHSYKGVKLFDSRRQKHYYKQKLADLADQGYIILGKEKLVLTPKGKRLLKLNQHDEMLASIDKTWTGLWQLVSYDIPNSYKNERDYFRSKLIKYGFSQIHKSLWVLPYECKEEIAVLTQSLEINPFVVYLHADKLPEDQKYLEIYGLSKI